MITTLSAKGQIVIPQAVRARHKLKPGTDFTVITRCNGEIILRPVKASRRHASLAENLLALSGVILEPERAPAREIYQRRR
jgi:AbrB family looped-hinge helix DNA binding protein